MFFVSMMLFFRSGGAFFSFEQVGIRQELSIISLLTNYQTITMILEDENSCQVPCFFMRLDRGSFSQSIDYLSVMKNLACQLVPKLHTCYPLVPKPHAFHCLRNSCKNILQIWINIVPLQDRCGEICLLATTLKNAKMLTNGDRVARKPLFISMFCVFVTSPHQWDVFLYPDDCQEP
ncbi:unknown [Bacteroides sp. CAG:709]|nr:unknown [Bacteroides sp. CAG:709]